MTGRRRDGIWIGGYATGNVVVDNCLVEHCGGNGIRVSSWCGPTAISNCLIRSNGRNGIKVGRHAKILITGCEIRDNGSAGRARQGYGILRERQRRRWHWSWRSGHSGHSGKSGHRGHRGHRDQSGEPEDITLIGNVLADNRGRVIPGRSDANLANIDQVIDATDDQEPYTR